jgi:pyruvate formate lyase activating enzyme
METKGIIFDIQSFSVHDGPGCRTTVFMSGCPLRCKWCANPESWSGKSQILFSELSCRYDKGCSLCKDQCSRAGLGFDEYGKPLLNWDICNTCTNFACAGACCHRALKQCAKEYTVDGLLSVLKRDANHWGARGGVTFSGGEPLIQNLFMTDVLKACLQSGFHTAIETTAYADEDVFLAIMKYIDFAFVDIKHMDREKHKAETGVYNDIILRNLSSLTNSDWTGKIMIRMPVIGGFNDDIENLSKLIQFMHEYSLFEINILPFHTFGESKWRQLGKNYDYKTRTAVSNMQLKEIQDLFLQNHIACYIAHDTAF